MAQVDEPDLLTRCRAHKGAAELLIPQFVPFELIRYVMFCDHEARSAWWPPTEKALGTSGAEGRLTILVNGDLDRVGFAPDLSITERTRPAPPGVDQRLGPISVDVDLEGLSEISIEDLETEFADDDEIADEDGDLFEKLYGGRRAGPPFADFVGWPVDDDESLDDEEAF